MAGFKPSYRLLPTVGMKCVSWHLDTAGLFAASVADVAFAAAAISGRDLRVDGRRPDRRASACCATSPGRRPAPTCRRRSTTPRGGRGRQRPRPRHHAAPVLAAAFKAQATIHAYEAARALASEYERARDKLAKGVLELIETRLCDQRRCL